MSNGIKVVKRQGHIEPLDLEKMHKMVELACDGLAGYLQVKLRFNLESNFMMVLPPLKSKESQSNQQVILFHLMFQTISMLLLDYFSLVLEKIFMVESMKSPHSLIKFKEELIRGYMMQIYSTSIQKQRLNHQINLQTMTVITFSLMLV